MNAPEQVGQDLALAERLAEAQARLQEEVALRREDQTQMQALRERVNQLQGVIRDLTEGGAQAQPLLHRIRQLEGHDDHSWRFARFNVYWSMGLAIGTALLFIARRQIWNQST